MQLQAHRAHPGTLKSVSVACAMALMFAAGASHAQTIKPYFEFKKPSMIQIPGDLSLDTNGASAPVTNASGMYKLGFEGISQYDGASFARNFIPPDTIGAVGGTQYMSTSNGAYAVFDKTTGARTSLVADTAFWSAAGQTGANGDTRVMYNADASRWVVIAFGASVSDIQIAVSDTDNALGGWKSTKFTGYSGLGFGGTADYPTLAMDKNAIYIGTNNFAPATSGGTNSFRGTTLDVIPLNSVFNAGGPTTTNMKQFVTPYTGTLTDADRGFAIQGVNSNSVGSTGKVVASSLFYYDTLAYKVNGLSTTSATGATLGAVTYSATGTGVGTDNYNTPVAARQPSVAIPANQAIVAAGDERTSSSVYEVNGRIYAVTTIDPTGGTAEDRIRVTILDAATFATLSVTDIGQAGYDYYQGSIGVNSAGKVVVGYNRSGLDPATGKISFMASVFDTTGTGSLVAVGSEMLLKESLTDDYHNGSLFGAASVGRQRWGDYSSVSLDPTNDNQFYVIGEFAREYNTPADGHPGGTGGSRWGTWVAVIDVAAAVPEPSTYFLMAMGLGAVGFLARRRKAAALNA
jgi:hypothetical protein